MSDTRIHDIIRREIAFGRPGDELRDVCEAFSWVLEQVEAMSCAPCECPCSRDAKTEALRILAEHNPDFVSIYQDEIKANAEAINLARASNADNLLAALKAVHERRIAWPAEIEAQVVAAIAKADKAEGRS